MGGMKQTVSQFRDKGERLSYSLAVEKYGAPGRRKFEPPIRNPGRMEQSSSENIIIRAQPISIGTWWIQL